MKGKTDWKRAIPALLLTLSVTGMAWPVQAAPSPAVKVEESLQDVQDLEQVTQQKFTPEQRAILKQAGVDLQNLHDVQRSIAEISDKIGEYAMELYQFVVETQSPELQKEVTTALKPFDKKYEVAFGIEQENKQLRRQLKIALSEKDQDTIHDLFEKYLKNKQQVYALMQDALAIIQRILEKLEGVNLK